MAEGYGGLRSGKHKVGIPSDHPNVGPKKKTSRPNKKITRGGAQTHHSRKPIKRTDDGSGLPTGAPPPDPYQDQVDALVRLRYGQSDLALAQQGQNINSWFPQYQQRVAAMKTASDQQYAAAQAATVQAANQQAQGPNLGPGVSADVQAQAQLAGASRQAQVGAFGQALGAAGQAQGTFLQNQGLVGGAAQLQALLSNQQARIQQSSDKGNYAVQARNDLVATDQKNALEQAAFGLDQTKEQDRVQIATQTSRDKAAQRKTTSRNQQRQISATSRNQAAARKNARVIAREKAQQKAAADTRKAQGAHQKTSNKALDRINSIENDTHRWTTDPHAMSYSVVDPKTGDKVNKTRRASRNEAIDRLRGEGFSSDEIHLALTRPWGPKEIQMAHRLGIRVKDTDRVAPKRRGASGSRPDTAGNPNVSS